MPHPLGRTQQLVIDVLAAIPQPATITQIEVASWDTKHRHPDVEPLDYDRAHGSLQLLVKRRLVDRLDRAPSAYRLTDAGRQATTQPRSTDSDVVDQIAQLLRAPRWPGASGLEDIAELVAPVRDITRDPAATWARH